MYGETIAGVTVIRAFGASSKFMRDMLAYVDTVCFRVGPLIVPQAQRRKRTSTPSPGCGQVSRLYIVRSCSC